MRRNTITGILCLTIALATTRFSHNALALKQQATQVPKTNTLRSASFSSNTILVEGIERSYYLFVPKTVASNTVGKYPLLLAFHGATGNPLQFQKSTQFNTLAQQKGYIVAYPAGINKRWNDGRNGKFAPPVNDVLFTKIMLAEIKHRYPINTNKIYATGISNGGFMVQRLACELSETFSAIASVVATIGQNYALTCNPKKPVPLLMINGTEDPLVPWNGGEMKRANGGFILSVPDTVQFWLTHNQNNAPATTTKLGATKPVDTTTVWKTQYLQPQHPQKEVTLISVIGGGHTWFGSGGGELPSFIIGANTNKLNTSTEVINFFETHAR